MSADSYVVLVEDEPGALERLSEQVGRRLAGAGWRKVVARPYLEVFAPATSRLEITEGLDGHGVVLGQIFDNEGRALSKDDRGAVACRPLDPTRAERIVRSHWGRYVLVRRVSGEAAVLRDPSGALEAVAWGKAGVTVIAPSAPSALDALLPDELAVNWDSLGQLLHRGGSFRHELALTGLFPIAAGALACVRGPAGRSSQVWAPGEIYRAARHGARPDIRAVVDRTVCAFAGGGRWLMEVSGGLDSAIVAGALGDRARSQVSVWLNHYVDDPEGDERVFARPIVERHGHVLTEVGRRGVTLSKARLDRSAHGFRPAINDLDTDYNDDVAARVEASGACGSMTGQGGDAVFFQMPSYLVALDEVFERRLMARFAVLHQTARWTGQSLWPAVWLRAWSAHRRGRSKWEHPWFQDLKGVPPGKALQIAALVNCQTFHGLAVRNRPGPSVHPLLSQPVMEAGLALSSVELTKGGRDRAAARAAYEDVLPPAIFSRRSKGELGKFYGEAVASNLPFLRSFLLEGELAQAGLLAPGFSSELTREALLWRGGFSRLISLALTEAWLRRWQMRIAERRT